MAVGDPYSPIRSRNADFRAINRKYVELSSTAPAVGSRPALDLGSPMEKGSPMNSSTQQPAMPAAGLASRYRQFVKAVKRINQRIAPGLYKSLRYRWGHPATMAQIAKVVTGPSHAKVQSGPFSGMLCSSAVSGNSIPKMLGVYELELHEI